MGVVGAGGVHVLDLSGAEGGDRRVLGVRWHWLRSGDGFDPQTREVVRRDGRERTPLARQRPDLTAGDIWSVRDAASGRMTELGLALVRSRESRATGVTLERGPRFEVVLRADDLTRAWQSQHNEFRRAFSDVLVTIRPR
jgi:hypothetical protein